MALPPAERARSLATPPPSDWRPFAPRLEDDGRLRSALVGAALRGPGALQHLAAAWDGATMPERRGRTAALVLRDLLEMGWQARPAGDSIEIAPPSAESKEAIRRQLEFGRNDQLAEKSTRRFLFGLERPGRGSGCRPVTDLIADGRRLAAQLAPIAALPRAARAEALAAVRQPYLELVTDERDPHSGIKRMDIWRYFRHMWATRYRTSPGRNLFYLIRDAAQPPGHGHHGPRARSARLPSGESFPQGTKPGHAARRT